MSREYFNIVQSTATVSRKSRSSDKYNHTLQDNLIGFIQPKTHHLEGGNYNADKLIFSNWFCIAVVLTLNTFTDNVFKVKTTAIRATRL